MRAAIVGMVMGLMIAGSAAARAEVTLTRDGKAVPVIVHNGYTDQAASRLTAAEVRQRTQITRVLDCLATSSAPSPS